MMLQPGLIVIRNALSFSEQIEITKFTLSRGADPVGGFFKVNSIGEKILNQNPHRGRMFHAIKPLPMVSQISDRIIYSASAIDKTIKVLKPTHALFLFYKTLVIPPPMGYIAWHKDIDPNDGEDEMPVVSFNLGDSCEFLVCNEKPKISSLHPFDNPSNLAHRIKLDSGDALIFGGASRYIYHAIFKIYPDSAPSFLPLIKGRINITARYAPAIIGAEDSFKSENFRSVYSK